MPMSHTKLGQFMTCKPKTLLVVSEQRSKYSTEVSNNNILLN